MQYRLFVGLLLSCCCVALLLDTPGVHARVHPVSPRVCPAAAQSAELELDIWHDAVIPPDAEHRYYVPKGCVTVNHGGFWRVEVCPGRWIRQLRIDDNVVTEQNILGVQSRWSLADDVGTSKVQYANGLSTVPDIIRQTTPALSLVRATGPAHARESWRQVANGYLCELTSSGLVVHARYENGTMCNAIRQPRSTTLELVCAEEFETPNLELRELATCQYSVTLAAREVCRLLDRRLDPDRHALNLRFGIRDDEILLSV